MIKKILFSFALILLCCAAFSYAENSVGKVSDMNFKKLVLDSKGVVFVDFFATWCGPCKQQGPIVERVASKMPNVKFYKLDVDKARATAQKYNVHNIPTMIIFKDGKEVSRIVGLNQEEALIQKIKAAK